MKKLLYISAAALLMFAGACDKVLNTVLVVDETYDTKNLDKTVTVLPGVTVAFEQEIKFEIGQLLGEATGEGSFLKVAGSTDPIFEEGDLMFRQDANSSNINPDVATLYDAAAGKAEFQNSIAVYMVDVPGMLNVSNKYTLSNPCFRLQLTSDWLQPLVMDVTMSVAGVSHNISGIPVQALASQTIYISAEGGFASDASESDFIFPSFSDLVSPLPYEIKLSSIVLHGDGVSVPAYTPGTPVSFSVQPSFILPASFTTPSTFSSALAFKELKVTPNSDQYKVGIHSISAHFEAENSLPLDIAIASQPNDSVSLTVPLIEGGTLASPKKTEGDILLEFLSYSSLSSLVTGISATATGTSGQLNNKQGITLTIKSVTMPEGVEIEFIDKKEEGAQ